MRKKIALCLCTIAMMVMMLCACGGTDPKTVDYNGVTYDQLYNASTGVVQALTEMTEENKQYIMQSGTEVDQQILTRWDEILPEVGEYKGYGEFTITKSGNTLTTDLILEFEKREVTFEMVYSYHNMELTGTSMEPIYSMGEKMTNAALNTVISMSVVFCVLILISLIIYCFNIFPYLEKKKKEKAQAAAPVQEAAPAAAPEVVETVTDDTELIAVIAAAIAASTGTSTSDFVVRSINRR